MWNIDVCKCDCHSDRGIVHCVPCCYRCPHCGERIKNGWMSAHKKREHGEGQPSRKKETDK